METIIFREGGIGDASESSAGKVKFATDAETIAGTATDKATTPANIAAKMATPGHYIGRAKGADIASASPLPIGIDGDYFDVTGNVGFATMTVAANRHFFLHFDAILIMTHHATNLDLPGEANITTAAGDVGEFFSTGANTVQCVNYTPANGYQRSKFVSTKTDTYNITSADFGKSLRMNSASDKIFNLPSVGASEDGARVTIEKLAAGKVTIDAADSDKIADSGAGDTIYNNIAAEIYASITLEYIHAIVTWVIIGGFGTWTSTD